MKASRMIGIGLTVALLAVGVAVPAFAGGWAVVTLDSLPQGVAPGAAFTIGFTVRQHGVTPLSNLDPAPQVTAKNAQTGEVVRSTATMPDLGLNPDEIDALIEFLNGGGDA